MLYALIYSIKILKYYESRIVANILVGKARVNGSGYLTIPAPTGIHVNDISLIIAIDYCGLVLGLTEIVQSTLKKYINKL